MADQVAAADALPLLVGVATSGQLKNYLVEVVPAEPVGWDVFYTSPDLGAVEFNNHAETWALVLSYVGRYGVRWHGGTGWDESAPSLVLVDGPRRLEHEQDSRTVELRVVEPLTASARVEVRLRADAGVEVVGAPLPADTGVIAVQVADGVEVSFGQPSGRLVGVDTWGGFADVVEAGFHRDLRDLPVAQHDVVLTAEPLGEGTVLEASEAPALVDLDAGVWWTRPVGDSPLVRVGENLYLSTDGDRLDRLGLVMTFPPGALATAVASARRAPMRGGLIGALRGAWARFGSGRESGRTGTARG